MTKANPEMIDDESPEWTEDVFRHALPVQDVLSPALQAKLGMRSGAIGSASQGTSND